MYTPASFLSADAREARTLMRAYPFVTLITSAEDETFVTHLPVLSEDAPGPHGMLLAHMAKANPHWRQFAQGKTIAVFHGPHVYISPSWYQKPEREVPTWNYAAVHAHGKPELIEGRDDKLALIDRTTTEFESGNTPPWTRQVEGPRLEAMLDAIVAFRMPVARLEAKFKMNQNRSAADREKVIAQLRVSEHTDLRAMADWMQAHEPA